MPAFSSIPLASAIYVDGGLSTIASNSQRKIVAVGPCESGPTNEIVRISNMNVAEAEFGADSEPFKDLHLAWAQGARNLSLVRSGGKQGYVLLTDSTGGTLRITPQYKDADILDRYKLVLTEEDDALRILIWDVDDEAWVYDSLNLLVEDEGIIDIEHDGFGVFTIGDIDTVTETWSFAGQTGAPLLGDLAGLTAVSGAGYEFTDALVSGDDVETPVQVNGGDGTSASLMEKYAALEAAYQTLDFNDFDYLIPSGVFVDDKNIAAGDDIEMYFGPPTAGGANDSLGYLWQYIYQGKIYTYFVSSDSYFSDAKTVGTVTINTTLVLTSVKKGIRANNITVQINAGGAAGPTMTYTKTETALAVLITDDGTGTTAEAAALINEHPVVSQYLSATGGVTLLVTTAATALAAGTGPAYITHKELTGEEEPAEVGARFADGADAEIRECNFGHQLASFCYFASTQWKDVIGFIGFLPPEGYSRSDVSEWVGTAPVLSEDDDGALFIDAPADNGSGLLGNKFMAGSSATSAGYRDALVAGGNTTDGYAYGGFIITVGASLPNGETFPYGVNDSDEATDEGGAPIDIGKHLIISPEYPILQTTYNGGTAYRGGICGLVAGKLVVTSENEEPFEISKGTVSGVKSLPVILAPQLDKLMSFRYTVLSKDATTGKFYIAKIRTAAHPVDSSYTRVSTIAVTNRLAKNIRGIVKPYFGSPLTLPVGASIQQALDKYMNDEVVNGMITAGRAKSFYSKSDRIIGKINIQVTFVPPFSLESVTTTFTLTADESSI